MIRKKKRRNRKEGAKNVWKNGEQEELHQTHVVCGTGGEDEFAAP